MATPVMTFPMSENPLPKDINWNQLSIELPGTKRKGQTGIRRNAIWPELITPYNQPIHTAQDIWNSGLALAGDKPCLGHRPKISTNPLKYDNKYHWLTYNQVDERRKAIGSTLNSWFESGKLSPAEGGYRTVGVWSLNRPEWHQIDLANHGYNCVTVSLYDTLGPESVSYIIRHAAVNIVFATAEKIPGLLRLKDSLPDLKVIVSIDNLGGEGKDSSKVKDLLGMWAKDKGVELYEFEEVIELGRKNPTPIIPATPDSIISICYTSGTTGNPKGAILTHGNMATGVVSCILGGRHVPGGALLSYLPLAHIYGRFAELMALGLGCPIGFFSGDHLRLLEDAQVLKPVYFPSVPRVLNRIYAGASAALLNGGVRGALLAKAIEVKTRNLKETGATEHAFWDALVFRKVRAVLGGNTKVVTSGSAPLAAEVLDFLKIALGGSVAEGYGMTENCGTCCVNYADDRNAAGTVGTCQSVVEIKLIDVPEMGYTSEDKPYPRGELLSRGANHFQGYYKDPENTKKTIDSEGWVHTGDVAAIDYAGRFIIIDRVKNIMKLSQGEYVALEKVENIYSTVGLLQSCFVYGDSLRDHLVAVVVPDPVAITDLARRIGVSNGAVDVTDQAALDTLTKHPKIYEEIMQSMNAVAKKAGLKGFETVKRVHITNEPFTSDNVLTATFKIRRKDAHTYFQKELDQLYKRAD